MISQLPPETLTGRPGAPSLGTLHRERELVAEVNASTAVGELVLAVERWRAGRLTVGEMIAAIRSRPDARSRGARRLLGLLRGATRDGGGRGPVMTAVRCVRCKAACLVPADFDEAEAVELIRHHPMCSSVQPVRPVTTVERPALGDLRRHATEAPR